MNKKIIFITIILIIGIITGFATYKVIKTHNDKLLKISELYIIEQAKKCYNEKNCEENIVTLRKLYDLGYLDLQVNPVTKEYYSDTSTITKEEDNYTFASN